MTKSLGGATYYLANEAATSAGVSKKTLLRWIGERRVKEAAKRDRNGWRLFSEEEVRAIVRYAQGVQSE